MHDFGSPHVRFAAQWTRPRGPKWLWGAWWGCPGAEYVHRDIDWMSPRLNFTSFQPKRVQKGSNPPSPKQASKPRRAFPKTWLPYKRELILAPAGSVVMTPAPKSVLYRPFFPKMVARRSPMGARSSTPLTLFGFIFSVFRSRVLQGFIFAQKNWSAGHPGCELIFEAFLALFCTPLGQTN